MSIDLGALLYSDRFKNWRISALYLVVSGCAVVFAHRFVSSSITRKNDGKTISSDAIKLAKHAFRVGTVYATAGAGTSVLLFWLLYQSPMFSNFRINSKYTIEEQRKLDEEFVALLEGRTKK